MGCGTALPSLALFQWALSRRAQDPTTAGSSPPPPPPLRLVLADYNPTVLQLVTMPNFLLAWALHHQARDPALRAALPSVEGELEINEHVVASFRAALASANVGLSFLSGGWSPAFVELVEGGGASPLTDDHDQDEDDGRARTLVLGAETIYSPFALASFTETLLAILRRERRGGGGDGRPGRHAVAVVAAKRLYFGVGGSLDDFVDRVRGLGAAVSMVREETEGVRRGVVRCHLP